MVMYQLCKVILHYQPIKKILSMISEVIILKVNKVTIYVDLRLDESANLFYIVST